MSGLRTIPRNDQIALEYAGKWSHDELLRMTPPAILVEGRTREGRSLDRVEEKNILVHADNLRALRSLAEREDVRGRVRLVYIDPPFGTGLLFSNSYRRKTNSTEETAIYSDELQGSKFVEFLRRRLILLRELLSDDGSIYLHIDWKMVHYVRVVMDEIFGANHFVNEITRIKSNPKNFNRKGFGNCKDTVLFYSKTDDRVWNESREPFSEEELTRLFPRLDKDGRRYTTLPLHAQDEVANGETGQAWHKGSRDIFPPKGKHWQRPPRELEELDRQGGIEWSSTGNPRRKFYQDEARARGKKRQDLWEFKDPPNPKYPTEKNLDLLKVIIDASSNPGDLVLDAFCGSGTTLLAAELMGRRWIGIDSSGVAIEVVKKRIAEVRGAKPYTFFSEDTTRESPGTA